MDRKRFEEVQWPRKLSNTSRTRRNSKLPNRMKTCLIFLSEFPLKLLWNCEYAIISDHSFLSYHLDVYRLMAADYLESE